MIVTVLMSLEGANPEISRCVNVDTSMHLGQLSAVIDAAFGFSGAATHLYTVGEGGFRKLYTENPGPEELDEAELSVGDISEMTYIYDPAANWNIAVEVLGQTQLDGPTPLLVDAAGPDIVEATHGPAMMTRFREEARRIAAGLPPNMEVTPLLLSFLPVMSPERILQRVTVADPVSVAARISFVAEDLFFDEDFSKAQHFNQGDLASQFEDFLDSRPDLRHIIETDPQADRNPTLLSAVADFFEDKIGETGSNFADDNIIPFAPREEDAPGFDTPSGALPSFMYGGGDYTMADVLCNALALFTSPVKLTSKKQQLPSAIIQDLCEIIGITALTPRPTEKLVPEARQLRDLLEGAGFIAHDGAALHLTEAGNTVLNAIDVTGLFIDDWARGFERVFGKDQWRENLTALGNIYQLGTEYGIAPKRVGTLPEGYGETATFLLRLRALEQNGEAMELSYDGRRMFGRMLGWYEFGV